MRFRRLEARVGFSREETTAYLRVAAVEPAVVWLPPMRWEGGSQVEFPKVRPERVEDLAGPPACVPQTPPAGESQGEPRRVHRERVEDLVGPPACVPQTPSAGESQGELVPSAGRWVLAPRWVPWKPDFPVAYQGRPRQAAG